MFHIDNTFITARDFLDYFLRDNAFRTTSKFHANQTGSGGMIFRGQSDSCWQLMPSAFRAGRLDKYTPQPPYEPYRDEHRSMYLGLHLSAESRAVFLFLEAADAMGLLTPIDYTTTRDAQAMMQAAFDGDKNYNYGEAFPSPTFQRATALAQHHGVPTRYLDWSESPLVAAYFAALSVSKFGEKPPRAGQEIAVYFTSTFAFADDSPIELVRAPRHENEFLQRQQGVFTNLRTANTVFLATGVWPALEDVVAPKMPQIHRARLPASAADDLLRELFDLGITRQSLMPSLDNAATAYYYGHTLFADNG